MTRNTRVRLFVSSGPSQVEVPDVVGLSRDSAEKQLSNAGLEVGGDRAGLRPAARTRCSPRIPAAASRVDKGTRVTITVSTGRPRSTCPTWSASRRPTPPPSCDSASSTRSSASEGRRRGRGRAGRGPAAGRRRARPTEGDSVVIVVGKFKQTRHRGAARRASARALMRVAVLAGGRSSEHEISLASAEAVRAGLSRGRPRPVDVRISRHGEWTRGRRSPYRCSRGGACSGPTWPSRCCTAPTARTASCRGCSRCSTSPMWAPG